jgi:hypothetical protein
MGFLILIAVVLIIGLPIWMLIKINSHSGIIDNLEAKIGDLELELDRLKRKFDSETQATAQGAPQPEPADEQQPDVVATEPSAEVVPPKVVPVFAETFEAPPVIGTPPPIALPRPVRPAPEFPKIPTINWEQFMGVKLFAWIGGLAMFLAFAYALKYSFDNNLISPELRVGIGFLSGVALLVGGVILSRKEYVVTAQTLCGTGVVILYAVTFACRTIYHFPFFGQIPTFLVMALITVIAFMLAVRLNALVVAVLGILGGFLTPVLLSTGQDNPLGLFGYIGLLDIGLVAVALRRRWNFLVLLGGVGTVLMELGWVARHFEAHKEFVGMTIFLCFSVLFIVAYLFARREKQNNSWFAVPAIALPFFSFGFALYLLGYPELRLQPAVLFGYIFLVDLCLLGLTFAEAKLFRLHIFAGLAVFSILAIWTIEILDNSLLKVALAFYLLFALLHSVFPIVLQKLRPSVKPSSWAQLFPPLALLLIMVPIVKIPEISPLIWPCILLLDLIAIGLAVLSASVVSVAAVLILSLVATALWILRIPAEVTGVSTSLLLIGGFAVFFFVAAIFASRKILAKWAERSGTADAMSEVFATTPATLTQLPAMSAIMPFLLLIMVSVRLPMTNPSPVFGLALLLLLMLLGLARKFTLDWLPAVGLACVVALEHAWHFKQFQVENAVLCLAWYVGFYASFAIFPFLFRKHFAERTVPWAVAALSGIAQFFLVHRVVVQAFPNNYMGLLPAIFVLPALLSLMVVSRKNETKDPARMNQLAWFGGVALFFVTLIFPLQFERQWITLSWALEGTALLWLYHRIPHNGLRIVGVGLLFVAFCRLAVNPAILAYHPRSATPILNWYLYSYGVVTLCLFAGAKLLARPRNIVLGSNVPPVLWGLGTVLAFLLLNIEIADYFNEVNQTLTFDFSGGNLARGMTYTISWALFALVLVTIGIARKLGGARYAGLGLLVVTLLKLFFHDLVHLSQLYRIGALISVAVIAILASFFYQKFFASNLKAGTTSDHKTPQS